MLTLHTWTTPNGRKIPIMLEELGLQYTIKTVNIGKGEQFQPEFLAISPNNKIPAIVDTDADGNSVSIFESGAILTYLAEKTGKLLPAAGPERYKVLEWLHWQIGGLGPMLGQVGFFAIRSEEKSELAIQHFIDEADRLLGVMEKQLSKHAYIAGAAYSIADIACYPWTVGILDKLKPALGDKLETKPHLQRWLNMIGARPAVQRGMALPKVD
ncbi:glutathione S-transferase family protein [Pseudoduganella sp. FT25W]|jgi:GST-like protein|uniref:Glutathione S-transferase family protein n=1 Tax=Duganella alba TaxID=2666081 RepID=A0A6L5QF50_9BURK|nr:glutathione binding-like protein [Duganella alba]MRX08230.1 glutathione S-transferase family protein [Duganella alba]MRX16769.1 glutathione S-transferase family protein [Duganella alba]